MQFNGTQAYRVDDRVAILQKDLPARQSIVEHGRLIEAETYDPALEKTALAHAAWSSMAYEKSLYRLSPAHGRELVVARAAAREQVTTKDE
jgi:hypothetical protein